MLKKFIKRFARFKFYSQRVMVYYQMATSLAIWVIFLREYKPVWWVYVLSIFILLFIIWLLGHLDRTLKILQYEQTEYNNENAEITEIKNNSRTILKQLEEIKNVQSSMVYENRKGKTRLKRKCREAATRTKKKV